MKTAASITLHIVPKTGKPYEIKFTNDIPDSWETWIKENLNTQNIISWAEIDSRPQYCYVEVTERAITNLLLFDDKESASHFLHERFVEKIKEKDEDFMDFGQENEECDEWGFNETSAWINDMPITHDNWDAYVLTIEKFLDTDIKELFLNKAIEEKYLISDKNDYENLLRAAYKRNDVTMGWHPNMGPTTDTIDKSGKITHIFTNDETCQVLSAYMGKTIVRIISNEDKVLILCER